MEVWVNEGKAYVSCTFQEKELVKAIGNYKFDKPNKCWVFPEKKVVDIIDHLKIKYSPETKKVYDRIRSERKKLHEKINVANTIKNGDMVQAADDKCYYHQRQAVELGMLFGSYAFFMETGTGKSLVAITLSKRLKGRTLIVTPLPTIKGVWVKEIKKWSPELQVVILWNNIKAIKTQWADVFLINFEQFKKLDKSKYKIQDYVSTIIIDESSKMKNPRSDITKTLLKYNECIKHRFCLTGTPAPNNLLEYWGQMAFVNPDILGDSFYKFRNTFFRSGGYGGFQYWPMRGAKEAIIENVSRQAYSIRKKDCLDLPERVYIERSVVMDDIQYTAYQEMKEMNLLEIKGDTILSANQLAKIMKLRQVTSGFVINNEGFPVLVSETKMDSLKQLLEEIPEDEQVIIWCQFHYEIERIFNEYKDSATILYGGMSQKEKDISLESFLSRKKRILIGHPKTGGMGLNLQENSSYMVWYSLSYSQEEYSQACDRIYRSGQKNVCTYYLLLARKTIDEIIYKALVGKANLMYECMDMLKKGIG